MFADRPMPALLQSTGPALVDPGISRWSILCADPFERIEWSAGDGGDPFLLVERAVATHAVPPEGDLPFLGGAIGYIGYEVGHVVETIRTDATRASRTGLGLPDMLFGLYAWAIIWDHHARTWGIVSSGAPETGQARVSRARQDADDVRRLVETEAPIGQVFPHQGDGGCGHPLGTSVERDRYLAMVREARRLIEEGEIYQVNLSQRLELPAPERPIDLARALATHSPSPFSAWIDAGDFQIASASPERFVSLSGRRAESRPIKGTRPRSVRETDDRAQLAELIASPKDRAENIMIVDLVRNDLGRVCLPGTVIVREICRPESYASVHHLVSIITGELADGQGPASLLRALFPGGSMTGAPKIRAMQAIADLEPVRRDVYSGALGYLSFGGALDLSIVIRTAIVTKNRTWLSVGGGIVADSDPIAEHAETLDKAASILRALASIRGR